MKANPQESIFARAKRLLKIKSVTQDSAPAEPVGSRSTEKATPPLVPSAPQAAPQASIFDRAAALIQSQTATRVPSVPQSLLPTHPTAPQPALSLLQRYQATTDPHEKATLFSEMIKQRENRAPESRAALVEEWKNETDATRKLAIRNRLMSADLAA